MVRGADSRVRGDLAFPWGSIFLTFSCYKTLKKWEHKTSEWFNKVVSFLLFLSASSQQEHLSPWETVDITCLRHTLVLLPCGYCVVPFHWLPLEFRFKMLDTAWIFQGLCSLRTMNAAICIQRGEKSNHHWSIPSIRQWRWRLPVTNFIVDESSFHNFKANSELWPLYWKTKMSAELDQLLHVVS